MITREMKISEILKKYPLTLEVFVRISPHFKKLENQILRKALASRVNVEQINLTLIWRKIRQLGSHICEGKGEKF